MMIRVLTLIATLLGASAAFAENWITLQLRLDPGRAGHAFSLLASSSATLQHGGLIEINSAGASHALLEAWIDADEPFTLRDDTTGDLLDLAGPWSYGAAELRGATWWLPQDPETGVVAPSSRQYFLVGPERVGHSFLLSVGNGWFTLALPLGGGVPNGSGETRFELAAECNPAGNYWLIDLSTNERSPDRELNLAVTAWAPNTAPLPVVPVHLFLGAAQTASNSPCTAARWEESITCTRSPLPRWIASPDRG